MPGPRYAMLVHIAMTLSTVHGWSLPEPVDDKSSSLSSHESAITGGVDGSRDRRQLSAAARGCFSCDESCDGCDASCDGFLGWGDLARDGCDSSCDFDCDAGCDRWRFGSCDASCDDRCDGFFGGSCDSGCDDSCDTSCWPSPPPPPSPAPPPAPPAPPSPHRGWPRYAATGTGLA